MSDLLADDVDDIKDKTDNDDDLLKEAREAFEKCEEAESDNREAALDDLKFAVHGEQWDAADLGTRTSDKKPTLTINKLKAHIRQVVNDARQNKPSIKVRPVDSKGDPETADVINGLIRNIEQVSNADIAYDTAVECAVSNGFGYIRVGLDYAFDDTFDMDITMERVLNPLSVYGDPNSTSADGSDWNVAFVTDKISEAEFKNRYPGKDRKSFEETAWTKDISGSWRDTEEGTIIIAEWWTREEIEREIVQLDDGSVRDAKDLVEDEELKLAIEIGAVTVKTGPDGQPIKRKAKSYKVKQRIISGVEVLETRDWPGKYIPIAPVYGEEYNIEGKRYFRSLIHGAKDAQRQLNFWRSTATELISLTPRVPFIGPVGAFDTDIDKWNTINTRNHPFIQFDTEGMPAGMTPQRQPLDTGPAAGALQEAMNASDDIKAIIGMYDASLGARSNETSGKAIMARQREGDVSTFHFIDNVARAIRHTGRILLDLIPKVYDKPRIIRIVGEDGSQAPKQINQQAPQTDKKGRPMMRPVMGPNGQPMMQPSGEPLMQPIMALHDLTVGKYDLTVHTGPSFTSRREEAAAGMTELMRAFPPAAPIIAPELAKNMDWPGADDIAEKFEQMGKQQVPPELQKKMQEMGKQLEKLQQENQSLKMNQQADMAKLRAGTQADMAKIEAQKQADAAKAASARELAFIQIQSDEQIAQMKIASEERIAMSKAAMMARTQAQAQQMKADQAPVGRN